MEKFFVVIVFTVFLNTVLRTEAIPNSRIRRHAVKYDSQRWPGGIVPVVFDPRYTADEKNKIATAMVYIHDISCVRFVYHGGQPGYVYIVKGDGCSSVVGHTGRRQELTLASGCVTQNVILHELMHTLGFHHEHSRPDRDDFIRVLFENIQSHNTNQFPKFSANDVDTLGLPYDTRSIMHYDDAVFTKDRNKKTIVPKRYGLIIGKADGLSWMDKRKLNKLYRC